MTADHQDEFDARDQALLAWVDKVAVDRAQGLASSDLLQQFCLTLANATPSPNMTLKAQLESRAMSRLQLVTKATDHRAASRRRDVTRRLRFAVAGIAVILIAVVMAIGIYLPARSFAANALAQFFRQQFGVVLIDQPQLSAPVVSAPNVTAVTQDVYPTSFDEAQKQVPFRIPQPTWLPGELKRQGALAGLGPWGQNEGETLEEAKARAPIQIHIFYRTTADAQDNLTLVVTKGKAEGGYAYPASKAQTVSVNRKPATYIGGSWNEKGEWNSVSDSQALSWEADGFTYLLQSYQLGLSLQDMIRIAESVK